MTTSQNREILAALKRGETLTQLEAISRFGSTRLAARINDLRLGKLDGVRYDIETEMVGKSGKRFARYRMKVVTDEEIRSAVALSKENWGPTTEEIVKAVQQTLI